MSHSDQGQDNPFFAEFLDDFYSECDEHLVSIRRGLLALERAIGHALLDRALLDSLFRSFHSLKGLSGMVGLHEAESIAHHLESYLRALRQGQQSLSAGAVETLAAAIKTIEHVLSARRVGLEAPPIAAMLQRLEALTAVVSDPGVSEKAAAPGMKLGDDERERLDAAIRQGRSLWHVQFVPRAELNARSVNVSTVRARLEEIGELIHVAPRVLPDTAIAFDFLLSTEQRLDQAGEWLADGVSFSRYEAIQQPADEERPTLEPVAVGDLSLAPSNVVRVDLARLDEIIHMVGELMISRSRLDDRLERMDERLDPGDQRALADLSQQMERQLRSLREGVMRARLVPIGTVFERMQFVIRDLAQDLAKEVELRLSGQETEIDKFVVERMLDPLLHLVRNALSHGLESPEQRLAAGKPACGTISLRAATAGDAVLLEIEDDGAGIDLRQVAEQAVRQGLVLDGEPLESQRLIDILAAPGFSVRAEADRASGRGIGMAAVRNAVHELGGSLEVETWAGGGTRFSIHLPLTLAIVSALIVSVAGQTYSIPVPAISEVIEIDPAAVSRLERSEIIRFRGAALPLLRLAPLFDLPPSAGGERYGLVVGGGGEQVALVVDRFINQREIVVRPLTDPLVRVPGIAGATELGDGRVVLILDAPGIVRGARQSRAEQQLVPVAAVGRRSAMAERPRSAEPYILFQLNGTSYGLRSSDVLQMEMIEEITPVPNAPAWVDGVVFSRGQVVPAINLRARFGFEKAPYDLATRLVIVQAGQRNVGLVVDTAREFVTIAAESIQPPPETISGLSGDYLEGIASLGERLVLILNVAEVLESAQQGLPLQGGA